MKTTCFLSDLDNFAAFNAVYGRYFGSNPAPRSTVQVAKLPLGSLVEVECIALVYGETASLGLGGDGLRALERMSARQ